MKKRIQNYIALLLFGLIFIPSIALASWWNPFSWFNGWSMNNKKEKVEAPNLSSTSSIETDLKTDNEAIIKAEVKAQVEATLKAKADEQIRIDNAVKSALEKQSLKVTQQPQVITTIKPPSTISTEKNYFNEAKIRVKKLIDIHKTYGVWLRDTNSQFRSVITTLAGYNDGGLYGKSRDANIDLANANTQIIDKLLTNNQDWILRYEGALDLFNSNTSGFLDESGLNLFKTPESTSEEIERVKKSINEDLKSVTDSLKWHL